MEDANKIVITPEIKKWYSKLGAKGGSRTSDKKKVSSPLNGHAPCHPGKRRGRPKGVKNKPKVK